jgi:hypothetical protein
MLQQKQSGLDKTGDEGGGCGGMCAFPHASHGARRPTGMEIRYRSINEPLDCFPLMDYNDDSWH